MSFNIQLNLTQLHQEIYGNNQTAVDALGQILNTQLKGSINIIWVSLAAYLVFFMQTGFSFLEAGCVQFKNQQNILLKNFLDVVGGTIVWWLIGFGFAMDQPNKFIGDTYFAGKDFAENDQFSRWLFQWAFSATAATIVSGAVAERIQLECYFVFSMFVTGWVYPVVVHWVWGGGWLADEGFIDFAGSGVVHMIGGFSGLAATIILGRRLGRFDSRVDQSKFFPSNISYVCLGTMLLWFGWYGFNCGSTFAATPEYVIMIGRTGMTTTISACAGGLSSFATNMYVERKTKNAFSLLSLCNGILAGLVSVTASCNNIEPYGAFIIGCIAGPWYQGFSRLMQKLRIDDPLDAVSIHGFCGFLGILLAGWFDIHKGIFYGDNAYHFGVQIYGGLVIALWAFTFSFIYFSICKYFKVHRVSREQEKQGMDISKHGGRVQRVGTLGGRFIASQSGDVVEVK